MGFFDDALKSAVPGGDLATPIAIAAGALILGHFFGGSGASPAPAAPATAAPAAPAPQGGGLLGGLADIVAKLNASGSGAQINSWIANGANQPIEASALGAALGQQSINDLAAKLGMNPQDLLNQLALVLPKLVNNLTPNGRLPTAVEAGQ
jgi:uncharacterized protein YidB (DUF937 family)